MCYSVLPGCNLRGSRKVSLLHRCRTSGDGRMGVWLVAKRLLLPRYLMAMDRSGYSCPAERICEWMDGRMYLSVCTLVLPIICT